MSYFNTFALFFLLHKIPILDKINLCVLVPGWLNIPGEKSHSLEEWFCFHFVISLLTGSLSCPEYISPYSHHSGLLFFKMDVSYLLFSLQLPNCNSPSLSAADRTLCFENQSETPHFWCSWRMSLRLSCSVAIILTSLWYLPIPSLILPDLWQYGCVEFCQGQLCLC